MLCYVNFTTIKKYKQEMESILNVLAQDKAHISVKVSSRQGPECLISSLCLWDNSIGRELSPSTVSLPSEQYHQTGKPLWPYACTQKKSMACQRPSATWLLGHRTSPLQAAQEWADPGVARPPVHCSPDSLGVHWPTSEPATWQAGARWPQLRPS